MIGENRIAAIRKKTKRFSFGTTADIASDYTFLLKQIKRLQTLQEAALHDVHPGWSLEKYLHIQFPATQGHIPLNNWIARLENAAMEAAA